MARVEWVQQGLAELEEDIAYGLLNFGYAVETDSKREAPVRGGHRSFDPDGPTGGTLRRSGHTVVLKDGRYLAGAQQDENGDPVPDYPSEGGLELYVGHGVDYAAYVEMGTVRMAARPYLAPAFDANLGQIESTMAAGIAKRRGGL